MALPKILGPNPWELHVTLFGKKRVFPDVIKLKILRWGEHLG